jgi:hypothetical protein
MKDENSYTFWVEKSGERKPLGRPRRRLKDNIKVNLKEELTYLLTYLLNPFLLYPTV